jgi:hypothetical protein
VRGLNLSFNHIEPANIVIVPHMNRVHAYVVLPMASHASQHSRAASNPELIIHKIIHVNYEYCSRNLGFNGRPREWETNTAQQSGAIKL